MFALPTFKITPLIWLVETWTLVKSTKFMVLSWLVLDYKCGKRWKGTFLGHTKFPTFRLVDLMKPGNYCVKGINEESEERIW